MRSLKFRVWSEEDREYRTDLNVFRLFHGKIICTSPMYNLEGDRFDVEQYTGLKDKNGKEIYEGDVVGSDDGSRYLTGVVAWNEDYAKYEVIYNQLTGNSFEFEGDDGYPVANLCEVIGNIHENPELLEEEE